MRARSSLFIIAFVCSLIAGSFVRATAQEVPAAIQTFVISDSRTGTAPCGFPVQRDLEGTVSISTRIDDAGNLVLSVEDIDLGGTISNPANGTSVEVKWVGQNGKLSIGTDGVATDILIGLEGTLFRGYDTARSQLAMDLPVDGGPLVSFSAGTRADDPWAHICGLLS